MEKSRWICKNCGEEFEVPKILALHGQLFESCPECESIEIMLSDPKDDEFHYHYIIKNLSLNKYIGLLYYKDENILNHLEDSIQNARYFICKQDAVNKISSLKKYQPGNYKIYKIIWKKEEA